MLQPLTIPVPKLNSNTNSQKNQFYELMKEISYACKKVQSKKWTLAEYYNHMADFHDYINDPAPNLRALADKWIQDHSAL